MVLASVPSNTACTCAWPVCASTREKFTGMTKAPMQVPWSIAARTARSLSSMAAVRNQPESVKSANISRLVWLFSWSYRHSGTRLMSRLMP